MAEEETLELDFEPMEEIGVGENEDLDVADKLDLPESSEDEKEQSPQKSVINELVSPRKRDRRAISPPDFEEEFRVSSHLAGRLTRVRDNESHDRPKLTPLRTITRKDWGLETPAEDSALTNEEIAKVYESLDVDLDDNRIQLNTIFVKGIDSFNEYEIEKIFAEYEPISSRQGMPIVRFVDRNKSECVLTFKNLYKVAEMFLGMSKELKRVRPAKKPEEGEVMDSEDDEEGQVREENGEDVAVVNS
uniref:RRM domain-containing protein n=1 Tax=Acrobeloides nanus TaxID=290746 RepID=A0A914E009_9BILA